MVFTAKLFKLSGVFKKFHNKILVEKKAIFLNPKYLINKYLTCHCQNQEYDITII